jgi:hypothetical protein
VSASTQHFADPGQLHERRLHPRIFPKTLVYVACGAANGGMVLNAGEDGLAISMAIAVGGESFSNLLVRMNGLPQSIELNGRMAWTNVSRKRAGIQLVDVTGAQREQICEWLAFEGVREVHLVPQEAPKIVALPAMVVPAISAFDESRYSLLQAFGGSAPESLGPVPSLVDQAHHHQETPYRETFFPVAAVEMQPAPDFTDVDQTSFRDNEWDLADVALVPRKKSSRTGLPIFAVIFLWIAIPCFAIGLLVGRRPLERWLARGNARGENTSQVPKPIAQPLGVGDELHVSANLAAPVAMPSARDAVLSQVHIDATNYTVPDATGSFPLPQNTSVALLNSLSTQEVRAIKKSNVAAARDDKNPISVPAPKIESPAQQNYDEPMPKTLSVDSGLSPGGAAKISTPLNAQPAAPMAAPQVVSARRSPAAIASLSAPTPHPAPSRPVSPSASPSIAPVLPQPPLHGVMLVARKSDETFLLKLPLESVPSGHDTPIRMQRFVMVPRQSRWHRHGPIVKLRIGELLAHDAPPAPDAHDAPRAMNAAGDVITVRAFVDKNGAVEDLKPVSGRFALLPRVMRAVRGWQFDQTLLDGKPVESEVNVTMEFRPAR